MEMVIKNIRKLLENYLTGGPKRAVFIWPNVSMAKYFGIPTTGACIRGSFIFNLL